MSDLLKGILSEEADFADKVEKWKAEVKKRYPTEASKLKFKSTDQATKISAEIPGKDRSYGVFCLKSGKGEVLGEEIVVQADPEILKARREMLHGLDEAVKTRVSKKSTGEGELQPQMIDMIDKDVELKFPAKGVFGNYFSSVYLQGKVIKVDEDKKLFVLEYDNLRMNDETMAGGPGGDFKKYKTAFSLDDVDYIDENPHLSRIDMKS